MDARLFWIGWACLAALASCTEVRETKLSLAMPEAVSYGRDIRPILSDRCFACHGPDEEKRKADLRLDVAEHAYEDLGGYAAIVPGKPEQSELYKRIVSVHDKERMPPADSPKKPLSESEQQLLRRWIEQGAPYESHWSFTAPVRPAVPAGRAGANPIDRFIEDKLAASGLEPNPRADEATLLRRLFLDLTGLPPTPEELAAYASDRRADRWERTIERLMTEEPYATRHAERMAVPWLDASRYADTCGIHMDNGRSIWPWRNWVLEAYRTGMPFDRFITEQLAGDLFPGATQDQLIASGFHRNHVTTDEGGAIAEEYLLEYAVDRVSTTGSVLLGLTVGCARCHDHKYDPIRQQDFYSMMAFFNSIEEPGLYDQRGDPMRAFEPFLEVPSADQQSRRGELKQQLAEAKRAIDTPPPGEQSAYAEFLAQMKSQADVRYAPTRFVQGSSRGGAQFEAQPDGSFFVSGPNPDRDRHFVTLETQGTGLSVLALEALRDARLPEGEAGRYSPNGNAVLTDLVVKASSLTDPSLQRTLRFRWAWADWEQPDGNFRVTNVLDADKASGWAMDAHRRNDARGALFVTDEAFGWEGGTRLDVELGYESVYAQHTLGRVRLSAGSIAEAGLALLPLHGGLWHVLGPIDGKGLEMYSTVYGPESATTLDAAEEFTHEGKPYTWRAVPEFKDGVVHELAEGINVQFVAKEFFVAAPRTVEVGIGSDDGVEVFLDGKSVFKNQVYRGAALDQDKLRLELSAGRHLVMMKIINTGGRAGFAWNPVPGERELSSEHLLGFLPESVDQTERLARGQNAWRLRFSEDYRRQKQAISELENGLAQLEGSIPRTMVMKERDKPRETFVMMRGQYDKPDKQRPVQRGVPQALGKLPEGAPADRRGLAQWLFSAENPLVARVAVNRLWEQFFGYGLVRTSEDFGLQGEWPTHPELLDWLAVEFRESGWDQRHMLRLILSSDTYRRSARVDPQLAQRDPDNRLLARYPRRRLSAEEIRDLALYVSGLLVEKAGGPSVKPYQPDGLWEEVAMLQSNTRVFQRGEGEDLWRRSLYTYWKRAAPPPSMLTFDAPTREFCTIRRTTTNTPLQALVLWNDEQFREAARELAERTLREGGNGDERLARMYLRTTGKVADEPVLEALRANLERHLTRYRGDTEAAQSMLQAGLSPRDERLDAAELAAWTMVASALLSLDATLCRS